MLLQSLPALNRGGRFDQQLLAFAECRRDLSRSQFVQQRSGGDQIGGPETFGESAMDGAQ